MKRSKRLALFLSEHSEVPNAKYAIIDLWSISRLTGSTVPTDDAVITAKGTVLPLEGLSRFAFAALGGLALIVVLVCLPSSRTSLATESQPNADGDAAAEPHHTSRRLQLIASGTRCEILLRDGQIIQAFRPSILSPGYKAIDAG